MKTEGHRNKNSTSEIISTHCGSNPLFGLIHKRTWNKDWIANFCPIFSSFFLNKILLSETKSSGKGQSCFHFYFFSKFVGDYTVLLSSCIPKRVVQKASYFFILLSLFLGFKNEISFHIFHILFFSFINISSCKMICNSFFSLGEHPLMTSDIRVARGVQDSPQNRTL